MAAVAHYPWRPLGELLVEKALLHPDELDAALLEQRRTGRLLGQLLVERRLISGEQLTCVLAEQYGVQLEVLAGGSGRAAETLAAAAAPEAAPRPLGRLLLERGVVSQEELDFALDDQRTSGRRLGEILVAQGSVSWATVAAVVAEQHGVPQVDVSALREMPATAPQQPSAVPVSAPVYEVREGLSALYRSDSFLEATDFAFDHLEGEPRELKIVRLTASGEEEVWVYSAERAAAQAESPGLLQKFGFDVTRWTGPPPRGSSSGR
jgi:hypothetical protein